MEKLETARLCLSPMDTAALAALAEEYRDTAPELSAAYGEMLAGCLAHPEAAAWYAPWRLVLRDGGAVLGYAGFHGLPADGRPELGYGVEPEFAGRGFASEGAGALCRWALAQPGIRALEAESAADNAASLRVLEKLGFQPTGTQGAEGPRFSLNKP